MTDIITRHLQGAHMDTIQNFINNRLYDENFTR